MCWLYVCLKLEAMLVILHRLGHFMAEHHVHTGNYMYVCDHWMTTEWSWKLLQGILDTTGYFDVSSRTNDRSSEEGYKIYF